MLAVALAALHERDPDRLWPLIAAALPALCGGETLVYKLDEWSDHGGTVALPPTAGSATGLVEEAAAALREGYPFAGHYGTTPDRHPLTARQAAGPHWSSSPTARLLRRTMGADHVLGIPLPQTTDPVLGCLVFRSGRDFTDDHVLAARRIQPLLAAVEEQRQLLARWRATATTPEDAGSPDERAADCGLTPREVTVLLLLGRALTADAIGRRLGISVRTVHKHVENLYRKLGTRDRMSTVLRAQQLGLIPMPTSKVPKHS
ncbi:LuxR C-terminal-related transcriptional regulator [Streptomyces sp. S.PNR 29]|uniref:helix-turn-helix transcriptional regulator n=1 Tax=Streptomyces sp. S.PNR 29 TaxID=2973805 RepID=UPI0025AF4975|nr:LuxR C-terminal-related transcriptional regulator [Streptomyces sp. S.PNR 29]MDN0197884.1 LuxR C-terminal-related transcriptional regulator [Streptomyces sp. S.PNR 29]